MDDPLISYRYLNGGRVVEAQCSSAALRIEDGVAEPLTPEDVAIYERYQAPTEPEETDPPEIQTIEEPLTETLGPELDPDVDWPHGYYCERAGGYVTVFAANGAVVRSDTPTGKWRGREAGRQAAWAHVRGEE